MKASGISSSSQVDRNEYPHTEEGGSNASVMQVPRSENRFHGQYLSTLVKSNNMKIGDHFPIILVPDNSKKEKQHIPLLVLQFLSLKKYIPTEMLLRILQ